MAYDTVTSRARVITFFVKIDANVVLFIYIILYLYQIIIIIVAKKNLS